MTFEFTIKARQDILEAYLWYEQQRVGLGDEFILCLDDAQGKIIRFPQSAPKAYSHYYRYLLRRFPYALYYRLFNARIIVVGIFHFKRNPLMIRERLFRNN